MGSKADFYVGRGKRAEWLGSLQWDGLPAGLPPAILTATTEEDFRASVGNLLEVRGDAVLPTQGWPWQWPSSSSTKYTYAFDGNRVFACRFGSNWWVAADPEPDPTTLTKKAAVFPKMG